MGIETWQGDACSLVEAFRRGERSPVEELAATYDAIDTSDLNAFCHLDRDNAERAAARADVNLPFGGVPVGVKELDAVAGWPFTDASVPFKDRVAGYTSLNAERIRDRGGAVLVGQTTASEFGGVNVTRTRPARHDPQPVATRAHARRFVGRHARRRSPAASSPWRRPVTVADRSGSRPASAGWSA